MTHISSKGTDAHKNTHFYLLIIYQIYTPTFHTHWVNSRWLTQESQCKTITNQKKNHKKQNIENITHTVKTPAQRELCSGLFERPEAMVPSGHLAGGGSKAREQ